MDQINLHNNNSRLDYSYLSDDDLNIHDNMEGIEVVIHTSDSIPAPSSPTSRENPASEPWTTSMAIIAATSPEIKALNLPITPSFPEPISCSRSLSFTFPAAAAQSVSKAGHGTSIPKPELMIRSQSEYLPRKSFLSQELDREADKENVHPNSKLTIDTSIAACEGNQLPKKGRHRRASYASLPSPAEISPTVGNSSTIRETKWKSFSQNSPVGVDDFPFPPTPPPVPPISSLPKTIPAAYASADPVPSMRMKLQGLNLRSGFR